MSKKPNIQEKTPYIYACMQDIGIVEKMLARDLGVKEDEIVKETRTRNPSVVSMAFQLSCKNSSCLDFYISLSICRNNRKFEGNRSGKNFHKKSRELTLSPKLESILRRV